MNLRANGRFEGVKQAMNKEDERLKADLNRMIDVPGNEMKSENMSDTDREMASGESQLSKQAM